MIEKLLKTVDQRDAYLAEALKVIKFNEGETPVGLEEARDIIQPFFNEDKFFVESVKRNIKKLRSKFQEDDLERALAWVQAKKTRNHLIQRIEEAKGFREIAEENYDNYHIISYRKINVIRADNIISKTDFSNFFISLTSSEGFKQLNNKFKEDIKERAMSIIHDIKKKGYYDTDKLNMQLVDEETNNTLDLRLACNLY